MGYYSQAALCAKKKDFEELKKRLEKYDYLFSTGYSEITEFDEGEVVVWNIDGIKWYPSFKEIDIIEDFIIELQSEDKDYSFVRVGEDYNDIEYKSNYVTGECDRVHPYQGIDIG